MLDRVVGGDVYGLPGANVKDESGFRSAPFCAIRTAGVKIAAKRSITIRALRRSPPVEYIAVPSMVAIVSPIAIGIYRTPVSRSCYIGRNSREGGSKTHAVHSILNIVGPFAFARLKGVR